MLMAFKSSAVSDLTGTGIGEGTLFEDSQLMMVTYPQNVGPILRNIFGCFPDLLIGIRPSLEMGTFSDLR